MIVLLRKSKISANLFTCTQYIKNSFCKNPTVHTDLLYKKNNLGQNNYLQKYTTNNQYINSGLHNITILEATDVGCFSPGGGGVTEIWIGWGCGTSSLRSIPIFKDNFSKNRYPYLGMIFLKKRYPFWAICHEHTPNFQNFLGFA